MYLEGSKAFNSTTGETASLALPQWSASASAGDVRALKGSPLPPNRPKTSFQHFSVKLGSRDVFGGFEGVQLHNRRDGVSCFTAVECLRMRRRPKSSLFPSTAAVRAQNLVSALFREIGLAGCIWRV